MHQVIEQLRYDGATRAQVYEMLGDPVFRELVCRELGVLRAHAEVERDGPGMRVVIDQVQGAHVVPAFARRFLGAEARVIQTEHWPTPEKGHIDVAVPGRPGQMSGTAVLAEDPDGTTETANMTVTVHIPVVGPRMESFIAETLRRALHTEHRAGVAWLAGRR